MLEGAFGSAVQEEAIEILRALMAIVSPTDFSQENVCVLNTALLFFILIPRSLQQQQREAAIGVQGGEGVEANVLRLVETVRERDAAAAQNYKGGLVFWQEYYLSHGKGRDCKSLAFASRVPFRIWSGTASFLLERL